MIGADARYQLKGLELRGQIYYTSISNTEQYNTFTGTVTANNDLGKSMLGYYAEAGYNVFRPFTGIEQELIPFVRYEYYDMHNSVDAETDRNLSYRNTVITTGLTLKFNRRAVFKADIQFSRPASSDKYNKVFNGGVGVMF